VSNVHLVTNGRNQVTEVIVGFSGAVNPAEVQNPAEYSLTMAGRHGSFTARTARKIRIRGLSYVASEDTVLLYTKPFALKKPVQLRVDGTAPSGLRDTAGRLIDGARTGQPGSDAVRVLSRGGVSMTRVASGPVAYVATAAVATNGMSASTVDALMELNALANVTPPRKGGRNGQ
jgi:hypothetical protein